MFGKIKNLFIVDDGKPTKKNPVDPNSVKRPLTTKKETEIFSIEATNENPVTGNINPRFIEKLLNSIEKNNVDGFDYLEFKQTLQNLDKNMLEQTRYESAYAMSKTMNVSINQLKQSAKHYINVLKEEETKFDDALRNQVDIKITQKKKAFVGIEELIIKKEKQIVKLQKEIETHKIKLKNSNADIDKAKQKINRTKAEFDLSYHSVLDQIKDDLGKMEKYLKE